jgi:transposase
VGCRVVESVIGMKWLADAAQVYLHREYVDFRKAINGLVSIIESDMQISPYEDAVFVFCNRGRDKLKVIHWDRTGFVLWYKRLEESKYVWPRGHDDAVIELSSEQLQWLLSGYNLSIIQGHRELRYGP